MKVAVVGSRQAKNISCEFIIKNLPEGCTEIISGGASGVDSLAKTAAEKLGVRFTCFLPNYQLYGKAAPLIRNTQIINYADYVVAFWDGNSKGTGFVIKKCLTQNKPINVIQI